MAGPYARRGDWLENTTIGGRGQAAAAVDMVFQRCPAPSVKSLVHTLTDLGMPPEVVAAYFETHVELRRFGDVCVRWSGDSAANMAEAVLHVLGAPAAAEEIFDKIGAGCTSLRAVSAALSAHDRFNRFRRPR